MKALVVLFNDFSMQEISCATEIIAICGHEIRTCAISKKAVRSEDGFHIMPDYTFEEVDLSQYACVILPGIAFMFKELTNKKYAEFLSKLKNYPDILIASISCSPVFLAAAGLLKGHKYCGGLYNEIVRDLDFMEEENFVEKAILKDGNIITAIGFAYREFAFMIADHFNMHFDKSYFGPLDLDISKKQLRWNMEEVALQEWKKTLPAIKKVYSLED